MSSDTDGPRTLFEGPLWAGEAVAPAETCRYGLDIDTEETVVRALSHRGALEAYWTCWVSASPPPWIDMSRYVVVAGRSFGGLCNPPVMMGAVVYEDGEVRPLYGRNPRPPVCLDVRVERIRIWAIPRRILTDPFRVEVGGQLYELTVPGPGHSGPAPLPLERGEIDKPLGTVHLPEKRQVVLRKVELYSQVGDKDLRVWVVHRGDGSVSVLARRWVDEERDISYTAHGGFGETWDSHGRPFWGGAPMNGHIFRRLGNGRLEIGGTRPVPLGPIERFEDAPRRGV